MGGISCAYHESLQEVGAALATASALTLITATSASANWSSSIGSWTDGQESHHWDEEGTYSQVQFRSCHAQYATVKSVDLLMWVDKPLQTDQKLDRKVFTACFNGVNSWSNGEWTDIPSGDVTLYFESDKVGQGGSCCLLDVAEVQQDTSQAD
jgi:hypothetical protein